MYVSASHQNGSSDLMRFLLCFVIVRTVFDERKLVNFTLAKPGRLASLS